MTILYVILGIIVVGGVLLIAAVLSDPRVARRLGQAQVDLHALRRAREVDELRHEVHRDVRRLQRELRDEFRDVDS